MIHPPIVLISRHDIRKTVERLATEINIDYYGKNPLLIGALKGAFIFLADLVRFLDISVELEFIQVSSYGSNTESSGNIELIRGLQTSVKGRDVLVIEDIIDSGHSLAFILDYLKKYEPLSLKLCTLLNKASRRKIEVPIDYVGLTVPDCFLVGYGLDWDEKYRCLPDICIIETEQKPGMNYK